MGSGPVSIGFQGFDQFGSKGDLIGLTGKWTGFRRDLQG